MLVMCSDPSASLSEPATTIVCGCAIADLPDWYSLLEPETDLLLELDRTCHIIRAYPHDSKLCQMPLCGQTGLRSVFPSDFVALLEDRVGVTYACGQATSIELTLPGSERVVSLRARITLFEGGTRVLLRAQAGRLLSEPAQHHPDEFWQLFEAAPIPLAVEVARAAGEEGMSRVNRKFREVFGYDEHDVPSVQHWWPRAYPDPAYREAVRTRWFKAVSSAHDASGPITMETTVTCKDGTTRDIEFGVAAIGNRHVVTFVDLTESRTAQRALSARVDELGKALLEIRRLRGLLPVCAWCRKLRDDQGYWHELEDFFSRSTELTFTHGICPDCKTHHFAKPKERHGG